LIFENWNENNVRDVARTLNRFAPVWAVGSFEEIDERLTEERRSSVVDLGDGAGG
jgi:hypothetical protein